MVAMQQTRAGCPLGRGRLRCRRQNCIGNGKLHVKTFMEPCDIATVSFGPYQNDMGMIENMCLQLWRRRGTVRPNK
ncbi:hypothetical protein FZ938_13550 [Azospirillum oryzae]|nr:hypothetical protein FZ938_13550 [Azospirillum oryzae]